MGYLLEGRWHRGRCDNHDGAFVRQLSTFRKSISAGGRHPPAARRYRLYVSPACPWASRAIMVRKLKKLEAAVPMTVVHPTCWRTDGPLRRNRRRDRTAVLVRDLSRCGYGLFRSRNGAVLWDTEARTIVNNESSEIIWMLKDFDEWGDSSVDLYPDDVASEIDAVNEEIYSAVNNWRLPGGLATKEAAYHDAVWKPSSTGTHRFAARRQTFSGWGRASRKPTCGCSRPRSASISSTIHTSSATSATYRTSRTSLVGSRTSTSFRRRRDGRFTAHQASLLRKSDVGESDGIVPVGPMVDLSGPTADALSRPAGHGGNLTKRQEKSG